MRAFRAVGTALVESRACPTSTRIRPSAASASTCARSSATTLVAVECPRSTTARSPTSPASRMPVDKAMSERWYDEEVAKKQGESAFHFAICMLGSARDDRRLQLPPHPPGIPHSDVGIFMFPGYEGKGFGTDAMNALVDFGFGELGLQRVGLTVAPDNERAIRSYEKCGFVREGIRAALAAAPRPGRWTSSSDVDPPAGVGGARAASAAGTTRHRRSRRPKRRQPAARKRSTPKGDDSRRDGRTLSFL